MQHQIRLLSSVALVAWCLVQAAEPSTEVAELAGPLPTFRVSVACGADKKGSEGYDVVVTEANSNGRSGRKMFRGAPIVATSRKEAQLVAADAKKYSIFVLKRDRSSHFTSSCKVHVGAGSGDDSMTIGSVGVEAASVRAGCKDAGGSTKMDCSLWTACELACENSACQVRPVNRIENLESDLLEKYSTSLGETAHTKPVTVTQGMIIDAAKDFFTAQQQQYKARAAQKTALRALKKSLQKSKTAPRSKLEALRKVGVLVKHSIEALITSQESMHTLKTNKHQQELLVNQTRISNTIDTQQAAMQAAKNLFEEEKVRVANLTAVITQDQGKAKDYSGLMGKAEASLKESRQQLKNFDSENKILKSQVGWLSKQSRQAKERLQRLQVDAKKWNMEAKISKDEFAKSQMVLKLKVANEMTHIAKTRLAKFESKLKGVKDVLTKTIKDATEMKTQVKQAKKSWTQTEAAWEDTFRQMREHESTRISLQKSMWKNSLKVAQAEQLFLSTKQAKAAAASAGPWKAAMAVERATCALKNADAMARYYKAELYRLRSNDTIQKGVLQAHTSATAKANAKAKAATMALATAEAQALMVAQKVKDGNAIEKNARKTAMLRAEDVEQLTTRLAGATKKEISLGKGVDELKKSPKTDKKSSEKQQNKENKVVVLRFKLHKAQKATVLAVKQAHGFGQEFGELNKRLVELESIVKKYKGVQTEQRELAEKAALALEGAQSQNDATVAEIAAIGNGLKKTGVELESAQSNIHRVRSSKRHADLNAQLAKRKMQASEAMTLSKEAAQKRVSITKQRDEMTIQILKSKGNVIRNADLQASAHADAHVCLLRLQEVKQKVADLSAVRENANIEIQKISSDLTQQDDLLGRLKIQLQATSKPKKEKAYTKNLASAENKVNVLQTELSKSFFEIDHGKKKAFKLSLEMGTQQSALATAMASSREAKAAQQLDALLLESQRDASIQLEKYMSQLQQRAVSQKAMATKSMMQAADDDLAHDERERELEYLGAVTVLRRAKQSEKKYGEELAEVGQNVAGLRNNFSSDVTSEEVDQAKVQHLVMGASDAQFIVQQDREQRDQDVKEIDSLKLELGQEQHSMMDSFKRLADVEKRTKTLMGISSRLSKSTKRKALLLPMYEEELKHAKSLLDDEKNLTKHDRPSTHMLTSAKIREGALKGAVSRLISKDQLEENRMRSDDTKALTTEQKLQGRYQQSKKFWEHSKQKLFRVESNSRVSLHALEIQYNASLARALKADSLADNAIQSIDSHHIASEQATDIVLALTAAKSDAKLVQTNSEHMISQALDMVAEQELQLLKSPPNTHDELHHHKNRVSLVKHAVTQVAIRALDHAHTEMSKVKNMTTQLESARAIWRTAVTTTRHAVKLAHKIMQAHLGLLNEARLGEEQLNQALIQKNATDTAQIGSATAHTTEMSKSIEGEVKDSVDQNVRKELRPYLNAVKHKQLQVQHMRKKLQSSNVQLEKVRSELARLAIMQTAFKSSAGESKRHQNITLAQLTTTSDAESTVSNALKLAQTRATTLEHQGDHALDASKAKKESAYKNQRKLSQEFNKRGEIESAAAQLEQSERVDESTVTRKLAKWKQSISTRKQAPLLMKIALIATQTTATAFGAKEQASTMRTALVALRSTAKKQAHFQHQCSESKAKYKAEAKGIVSLKIQAQEYNVLAAQSKMSNKILMLSDATKKARKTENSRGAMKDSERAAKKVIAQKHKAVLRKLQSFASCKWNSDMRAQTRSLERDVTKAETETLGQHHTNEDLINRAGRLQIQAAQMAAAGKLSVINSALKMSTSSRITSESAVEGQQKKVKLLTKVVLSASQKLKKLTLQTLVVTSKAASLNSSAFPSVITTWEQEAGDADIQEAELEVQLLLKANQLLSLTPPLKEAFANVVFSSQEEREASVSLADAELSSAATRVKLQQRTAFTLAKQAKIALSSYAVLTADLNGLTELSEVNMKQAKESAAVRREQRSSSNTADKTARDKLAALQTKYAAAIVKLNQFRNDANFWMKKVNSAGPKASEAERALPKNFYEEVSTQKDIVSGILKNKIYASKNLAVAAKKTFLASAGVSEARVVMKDAESLKKFAVKALKNLQRVTGSTKYKYTQAKESSQKSRSSAKQLLAWHSKMVHRSIDASIKLRHSVLGLAADFATSVFSVQTALMHGASTKYRVLKAREKILLKLAKFQEEQATVSKNAVAKNTAVAAAEMKASAGASYEEFQDAALKAKGIPKGAGRVDRDTAVIAIMDAAQAAAKHRAAALHRQQKGHIESATRFTVAAKAVRGKFPACVARLRQGMINVRKAEEYAKSTVAALHAVKRESDALKTKP